MTKPDCPLFRSSAMAPWVCARWCVPVKGEPFCLVEIEPCGTRGLRFIVEVVQEDDGFQDAVDAGVK